MQGKDKEPEGRSRNEPAGSDIIIVELGSKQCTGKVIGGDTYILVKTAAELLKLNRSKVRSMFEDDLIPVVPGTPIYSRYGYFRRGVHMLVPVGKVKDILEK